MPKKPKYSLLTRPRSHTCISGTKLETSYVGAVCASNKSSSNVRVKKILFLKKDCRYYSNRQVLKVPCVNIPAPEYGDVAWWEKPKPTGDAILTQEQISEMVHTCEAKQLNKILRSLNHLRSIHSPAVEPWHLLDDEKPFYIKDDIPDDELHSEKVHRENSRMYRLLQLRKIVHLLKDFGTGSTAEVICNKPDEVSFLMEKIQEKETTVEKILAVLNTLPGLDDLTTVSRELVLGKVLNRDEENSLAKEDERKREWQFRISQLENLIISLDVLERVYKTATECYIWNEEETQEETSENATSVQKCEEIICEERSHKKCLSPPIEESSVVSMIFNVEYSARTRTSAFDETCSTGAIPKCQVKKNKKLITKSKRQMLLPDKKPVVPVFLLPKFPKPVVKLSGKCKQCAPYPKVDFTNSGCLFRHSSDLTYLAKPEGKVSDLPWVQFNNVDKKKKKIKRSKCSTKPNTAADEELSLILSSILASGTRWHRSKQRKRKHKSKKRDSIDRGDKRSLQL